MEGTEIAEAARLQTHLLSPPLEITRDNNQVVISWPASAVDYQLECAETLIGTNNWTDVTNVPVLNLDTLTVTNAASGPAKFYRLREP